MLRFARSSHSVLGRTIQKAEQRKLFGSPDTARAPLEQARKDATARWELGTAARLQEKLAEEANRIKVLPPDLAYLPP